MLTDNKSKSVPRRRNNKLGFIRYTNARVKVSKRGSHKNSIRQGPLPVIKLNATQT